MIRTSRLFFPMCFVVVLYSCAIQVAPQGGEKDITPPVLQRVTPASGSLSFSGNTIEFEFDENIQLKDIAAKLIVSPPLKDAPIVKARKNKLVVTFDDTLRAATTYTFNFGDAIVDLNEGNPIPDLQYVLSTGTVIDSMQFSGRVLRAEDLQPEKAMFVMLYPAASGDSAPMLERPLYFSRTNSSGRFTITHLAEGTYRVFGLMDNNSNYLYDDPSERMAFADKPITLPDSAMELLSFRSFGPASLIRSSADGPGKIRFVFNQPFPDAAITCLQSEQLHVEQTDYSPQRDSVTVWYSELTADSAVFQVRAGEKVDTITLSLKKYEPKPGKKSNFQLQVAVLTGAGGSLSVQQPLVITTDHPVRRIDNRFMAVYQDSVQLSDPLLFEANEGNMRFQATMNWTEEEQYRIQLLPGAFTDIFGLINDTLEQVVTIRPTTAFGTLNVLTSGWPAEKHVVLQLVDEKEAVYRRAESNGDTTAYFSFLQPGTFRLKLIDDRNANGRWDEGDYSQQLQPEGVYYYDEKIPVRANWDVEIKWLYKK